MKRFFLLVGSSLFLLLGGFMAMVMFAWLTELPPGLR